MRERENRVGSIQTGPLLQPRPLHPLVWMALLVALSASSIGVSSAADDASGVPRHVLFYDSNYSVVYGGEMEPAIQYFTAHGFTLLDTPKLLDWINRRVKDGTCAGTAVLQISDVTPVALVAPWDKSSALYRYCHAGGRYVAPGGTTLYSFEGEHDFTITDQGAYTPEKQRYLTAVFGVRRIYALKGTGKKTMPIARQWGLGNGAWVNSLQTGVPPEDVTCAFAQSEDDAAALAWLKTVNPEHPDSGLVGMCVYMSGQEPLLDAIYKICVYSGTPVTEVPAVDWRKIEPEPEFGVRFSMKLGGLERRAFQRGETIPLRVEVHGTKYNGQTMKLGLDDGKSELWSKTYPHGGATGLYVNLNMETHDLRCGVYELRCTVEGKTFDETLWVCPSRRNNPFPWFLCKMHRKNLNRERLALEYVRANNLNVNLFDLYQLEGAPENPSVADRLARYMDLMLRNNLMCSARPNAMPVYTDKDAEKLILGDGRAMDHGVLGAIGWRAILDERIDGYRDSLRRQVALLRDAHCPAFVPFFFTNDDGSMPGYYDFSEPALADFEKKTGVSRDKLPPMKEMSKNYFMPQVPPGVIPDDHPWLKYQRLHSSRYSQISQAAMEGIQTGWPGSLVADTGCMGGPLYIFRGFYPPLSHKSLNTAGFYQYDFWFHSYSFSIEAARMGNRGKPAAPTLSASWIPWGRAFQRGVIYRALAEAPAYVGFWSLDARNREKWDIEEESYQEMKHIGERIAGVAELLKRSEIRRREAGLFVDLAQLCFRANDRHFQNHDLRAVYENFRRAGAELDIVCTEEIMEGKAADYKVIFVSGHQWMTQGAKDALEAYIRNGGAVVIDSGTTIPIEGATKAEGTFGTVYPTDNHGLYDTGKPECVALCRKYVQLYLAPDTIEAVSPDTLIRVNQAGATPVAWALDALSRDELEQSLKARTDDWDGGVRNHLLKLEAAEPTSRKPFRIRNNYWAYDLWKNREVPLSPAGDGWNRGEVETEFCGATLLCLYRDRIKSLKLTRPVTAVERGDTARFLFELVSDRSTPVRGLVPVEVRVYYPDKSEAWEYGFNGLIEDGMLPVTLNTAVNDPRGAWRVAVRELCSGKTAETTFSLKS